MSWDVVLLRVPPHIKGIEDIPSDLPPIGSHAEILSLLREEFPTQCFSHPTDNLLRGDGWSIEINFSKKEPVGSLHLQVRGNAAGLVSVVAILKRLHLRAVDVQTSQLFNSLDEALGSFQIWGGFRDQALSKNLDEK